MNLVLPPGIVFKKLGEISAGASKAISSDTPPKIFCFFLNSRRKTPQGFLSYAYGTPDSHLHIFSDLLVKKLPSSSVFPSGPPTEDRSNVPTHEALGDAYQHIRDLEKQVALSEGKLQESQRCFDSVISSLASHIESTVPCVNDLRSSVENNTDTLASLPAIIAKPSYAQVASLPAAVSSFTIPLPPSEKVLLVRHLESNASSSTTHNKITSFLLRKKSTF
ncbi:hypothetical protein TNIN_308831 [Trichonephila inaurata madagascariensis]|uniref:Uncharacterized protein n=1 Tax=Trichonephila inaurata madagascariensis TaxID=2747483 RepID=A0A8X7CMM5_9ARAC|nr:hypothetical protein TNIN_308831 [Trichonephila inaurata madagascariensis]